MTTLQKAPGAPSMPGPSDTLSPARLRRHAAIPQEPADIFLDEDGMIQKCSKSFEMLFGYRSADLFERHISTLFPQLSADMLVKDNHFNPKLAFLCRCGHLFQAQDARGHTFKSELSFVSIRNGAHRRLRLIVRPIPRDDSHAAF